MTRRHRAYLYYVAQASAAALALALMFLPPHLPQFSNADHVWWLLQILPYALLPAVALLGLRLSQTRVFFVALYALAAYAAARRLGLYLPVAAVCLPLSVGLVLRQREGRLLGPASVLALLAGVVPAALLTAAVCWSAIPGGSRLLSVPTVTIGLWRLPFLAALAAAGGVMLLVVRPDRHVQLFSYAVASALVPMLGGLNLCAIADGDGTGVYANAPAIGFTAAGLLLAYALLRMYWENAHVDELTGILNRRALNARTYRLGRHYAVAMIDIDYFKAFNDTFGHSQGDTVLRYVASHLERSFGGQVYRYGGEEFCVLLDGISMREAARRVDNARALIAAKDFFIRAPDEVRRHTSAHDRGRPLSDYEHAPLSFSAGVAYRDLPSETPQDIIELADRALYWAKRAGRNRVICYAEQQQQPEEAGA